MAKLKQETTKKTEKKEVSEKSPSKSNKSSRSNKSRKITIIKVFLMLIWVFVSVVFSQVLIGLLAYLILGEEGYESPIATGMISLLSYILAMAMIIFIPPKVAKKWESSRTVISDKLATREEIGLKDTPTWIDIGLSPIALVVGTLGAGLLTAVFNLFPWFNMSEAQDVGFNNLYMPAGEKIIAFLTIVVLAPIVEEIIFRGWLYGKMRKILSAPISIILVSLLFGLMHFQWNVGVTVFALSVVLCILREITGTIYAGILTHMLKNGLAFYLIYVLM